jgi:hypothetical protein
MGEALLGVIVGELSFRSLGLTSECLVFDGQSPGRASSSMVLVMLSRLLPLRGKGKTV